MSDNVASYVLAEVASRLGIGVNLRIAAARLSLDGKFLELRVEDARNADVVAAGDDRPVCVSGAIGTVADTVMPLSVDFISFPVMLADVAG